MWARYPTMMLEHQQACKNGKFVELGTEIQSCVCCTNNHDKILDKFGVQFECTGQGRPPSRPPSAKTDNLSHHQHLENSNCKH